MSQIKKRVYISAEAYLELKKLVEENKNLLSHNRGMSGMLDLLILGSVTSKGSGRRKKLG